jgi:hypothetical protein
MRIFLFPLVAAFLIGSSFGCAVTPDMWKQATSRTMEYPHLVGSMAGPTTHPSAFVVCYPVTGAGMSHDRNFYVLFRLNPDGSVPEPFASHQNPHSIPVADSELGSTHREKIRSFAFTANEWTAGTQALHSPDFRKLDDPQGVSTIESMRNNMGGVSTLAFWPGGTAPKARFDPFPLPPNSRMFYLPGTQPRPESDRNANIAEAIVLTPVTLITDAVVDPLAYLVWAVRGDN